MLDDLVFNYNNSKNRSIMMKLSDVNRSNEGKVWTTLFGHLFTDYPLPKFKAGDSVRTSKYKWTFKVNKVVRGRPNMYELEGSDGESIIRKFYDEKLSAVDKRDDAHKVEKIKRKKVVGKKM